MLTKNHAQEGLSRAYIHAVAAAARVHLTMTQEFDYGFDGAFDLIQEDSVNDGNGNIRIDYVKAGFPIEFQLKCSWTWKTDGDDIVWSMKSKAYNKLARRGTKALPAKLILMCLPAEELHWVLFDEESLLLKKCCYYTTIAGEPLKNENSTKQIRIPRANLLNAASLATMLETNRNYLEREF